MKTLEIVLTFPKISNFSLRFRNSYKSSETNSSKANRILRKKKFKLIKTLQIILTFSFVPKNFSSVLVVLNFFKKRLDILLSEYGAVYNFRVFFLQAYSSFHNFNIQDFNVCSINVPKQQSKFFFSEKCCFYF